MSVSLCLPPPLFSPPGCFLSCLLLFPAIPLSPWMCFSLWLADVCVISRTVPPCFSLSLLPSRGAFWVIPTLQSACFRPHRGVRKSKSDCLLSAFLWNLFCFENTDIGTQACTITRTLAGVPIYVGLQSIFILFPSCHILIGWNMK